LSLRPKRVLWLDNDSSWIHPYVAELIRAGYETRVVTSVSAAESALTHEDYDLLILDVMIPTQTDAEEEVYTAEATVGGTRTGILFFGRMRDRLEESNTVVWVVTIRLEEAIRAEFIAMGLPPECFSTRLAIRERSIFIEKVRAVLN
jgi:DNA-binding response OmpR family regulator